MISFRANRFRNHAQARPVRTLVREALWDASSRKTTSMKLAALKQLAQICSYLFHCCSINKPRHPRSPRLRSAAPRLSRRPRAGSPAAASAGPRAASHFRPGAPPRAPGRRRRRCGPCALRGLGPAPPQKPSRRARPTSRPKTWTYQPKCVAHGLFLAYLG